MKEELLKSTKIGQQLQVGAELEKTEEGMEIGLFLASVDVSCSCAFLPEEWILFVEAVNKTDRRLKERLSRKDERK